MNSAVRAAIMINASAFALGLADTARAQTTPSDPPTDAVAPSVPAQATADAAQSDNSGGLADIIVTAEKRAVTLQKVPLAVTAVSPGQLLGAGVTENRDLAKIVPSLNVLQSGAQSQYAIRGAGSTILNAYGDPAVALNIDGVYIARPTGAASTFFDVERIEVLKGPQGTLYGRNATAGAINFITRKPEFKASARAELEIGNYDRRRATGIVNLPLGDTIAVRGAFQFVKRDGYYTDGYDDENARSGRLKLLWQPGEATSLLISGDYAKVDGKGNALVPYPFVDPTNRRLGPSELPIRRLFSPVPVGDYGLNGDINVRNWGISAQLDQAITDGVKFTGLAAHRDSLYHGLYYPGNFYIQPNIDSEQNSVELRLASTGAGPFQWLLGGYYYREAITSRQVSIQQDRGVFLDATTFTAANPSIVRGTDVNLMPIADTTYAAFGQATYALTPWLRLTAGGRYTTEKKTKSGFSIIYSPALPGGVGRLAEVGRQKVDKFNYKVGAEIDLAPRSMLYGYVSTGFKAGGFFPGAAPSSVNPLPNTYQPEEVTAYVVGSKNRFFDDRVQFNLEAYRYEIRGRQYATFVLFNTGTAVNGPFGQGTVNTQKAHIMGVEASLEVQVFRRGDLTVSLDYLPDSDADQFVFQQVFVASACPRIATNTFDCSGSRLIYTPKLSGYVGYRHEIDLGNAGRIVPRVSAKFQTRVSSDFVVTPLSIIRGYTIADAGIAYNAPGDRFSIELFANNFTNKLYRRSGLPLTPALYEVELGPPRTYGIRAAINF